MGDRLGGFKFQVTPLQWRSWFYQTIKTLILSSQMPSLSPITLGFLESAVKATLDTK